jgi:hypothetical protein
MRAHRHQAVLFALVAACGVPTNGANDPNVDASPGSQSDAASGSHDGALPGDGSVPPSDGPVHQIEILQGVDRAGAFTTTEANYLKTTYGAMWTGVYIGGACSAGSGWSKTVLTNLSASTGWRFMPIWVGQQSTSICSHATLTAAQGTTDGQATAAMMATYNWGANLDIPVVLDLEAGAYTSSPTGAKAYATAWRDAVRSAGYLAYLYSSPTAINAFDDAGVAFDGVWPADWYYTAFKSTAKPADLTQLGTRYPGTTRAWQYAGNVTTSGAGGVDADVSDLLLAPPPGGTNK